MSGAALPAVVSSARPDPSAGPEAALRADPRQAIRRTRSSASSAAARFRQLTNTHLRAHGIGRVGVQGQFGYNRGRPLMCRALQRLYAERAVQSGLADRIRFRPILVSPSWRLGGARRIALEEALTRREARRRPVTSFTTPPLPKAVSSRGR